MVGVSNESDKNFLEAVAFAFQQCGLAFSPKSEQLDAIYAVVTGKDVFVKAATGLENQCVSSQFRICAITSTGLKLRVFRIPVSAP